MQIGTGQSPLSLAVLNTLGVQTPGAPAQSAPATAAGANNAATPDKLKAAPAERDLGVDKTIPRGSFVDLKV